MKDKLPESTITQWESVIGCVNSTTVGASVKSVGSVKSFGSVKSVGTSVETYGSAVGTDGEAIEAAAGAAFEPIGVTVKNCNKLKRNEPGL